VLSRILTPDDWAQLWLAQYGFVGLGLGWFGLIWLLWRGHNRRFGLGLLAVLLSNLTFALLYRVGDPEVFMLPAWLAFAPLIGVGSAALAQIRQVRRPLIYALYALLLLVLVVGSGGRGTAVDRRGDWFIHDYAVALAKVDFPTQSQVIGLEGQITALRYMQQAAGLGQHAHGVVANDPAQRRAAIAAALQAGAPTFITQEVEGIATQYSFSGAGPLVRVWPRGQAIMAVPQQPYALTVADKALTLTGYDLERLAAAGGPTLRITFYWQPQAPLTQNYKLSLRLQNAAGAPLYWPTGNAVVEDHFPLRGVAPTSSWVTGEVVTDVHYLPLPLDPATQKQLYIVIYDAATIAEVGTLTIGLPPTF